MATATAPLRLASSSRIAALDGWRGIAILLVLIDHIQAAILRRYPVPWTQTGQHGVTIFFVLSGYLITSKLIDGPVDLKKFYIRRFFRLMPVAWTYLAFLSLLTLYTGANLISLGEVRACLLFYRNFWHTFGFAGHFWTLSLEEQFYLVWPCILFFLGVRRSRWFAIIGASSIAFYRRLRWAHYSHGLISRHTEVRADALLIGCLMAIFLTNEKNRKLLAGGWRIYALPCLFILAYGVARCHSLIPLYESVAIALLIGGSCQNELASRFLSVRPLTYLGLISYSVYVWQEFFMNWRSREAETIALLVFFPAFALGSYYGIEEPCRKLGRRLGH